MTTVTLYLRLAFGTGAVLLPGFLVARALGVRGAAASLAWSLVVVFGALVATFAMTASLTFALALVAVAGVAALAVNLTREVRLESPVPGRWWAAGLGAVLGLLLWRVSGTVQGDGLFHLARTRKLVELDELSLHAVGEFVDASLHPGYAFPLWHGFLGLIAKVSGTDALLRLDIVKNNRTVHSVSPARDANSRLMRIVWADNMYQRRANTSLASPTAARRSTSPARWPVPATPSSSPGRGTRIRSSTLTGRSRGMRPARREGRSVASAMVG